MNLTPYYYTGPSGSPTYLDGSTSSTHFSASISNTPMQPTAQVVWTATNSGKDPYPSGKHMAGVVLELSIVAHGTPIGADLDTLAAVFDVHDTTLRLLVCKDTDNTSRQWFVYCTPTENPKNTGKSVIVRLAVKSAYWLTVDTVTEAAWGVTATGQTKTYTINTGNVDTLPVIQITPTASKSPTAGGSSHMRFVAAYNRTQAVAHAYPIDITNGGLNTAALINDTTVSNQLNGAIGAGDLSFPIDTPVGGGLSVSGGILYVDTEQIYYTAITAGSVIVYNDGAGTTGRGWGGTTAASHADNAVCARSKMLASGDDIVIAVGIGNGHLAVVPRWLDSINTTSTKIWVSYNFPARAQGKLAAAINSAVTACAINAAEGSIHASAGLCLVDSELMSVTAYTSGALTGMGRGVYGTSAASHAKGAPVIFLNAFWMFYGDVTVPPLVQSDAQKPVIDLNTSTNSSWVYTSFDSSTSQDCSSWSQIRSGGTAICYKADQDYLNASPVDPVTDIGVSVVNKNNSAAWLLHLPFGYTLAEFTDLDRRNLPANQGHIGVPNGASVAIAATSVNNTWQSTSQTFTPGSTLFSLQLYLKNTKTTNYTTRAAVNAGGCTVTLDTTTTSAKKGVPLVILGAEQDVPYALNATLSNAATGESITLQYNMKTNETLEIDTLNKKITYLLNGAVAFSALMPYPARNEWLRLVQGANVITYTETGASGVTVVVKHQDRNNTAA